MKATISSTRSLTDGLVGHWKFNSNLLDSSGNNNSATEVSRYTSVTPLLMKLNFNGDATDSSGNGYDGTTNLITYNTGKLNQAASFAGVNSYVTRGIYGSNDQYTISLWFKISDLSQERCLWSFNGRTYCSITTDGKIKVFLGGSSPTNGRMEILSVETVSVDTWYHLIIAHGGYAAINETRHEYEVDIYLNNTLLNKTSTRFSADGNTSTTLYIGVLTPNNLPFSGLIDDFRLYGFILNDSERAFIYNSGNGTEDDITYNKYPTGKLSTAWRSYGDHTYLRLATSSEPSNLAFDYTKSFTFSLWFNTQMQYPKSPNPIIGRSRDSAIMIERDIFNIGKLRAVFGVRISSPGIIIASRTVLNLSHNEWHHAVGVYDAVNKMVYFHVNGNIDTVGIDASLVPFSGDNELEIGDQSVVSGNVTRPNYYLDDVRIYNRPISNTEALALYNLGRGTESIITEGIDISSSVTKSDSLNVSLNTLHSFKEGLNLALDMETQPTPLVQDLSGQDNDGEFKINASAYYPFNGNANDESINSNDGTVTNATLTTDHLGNVNNAYSFEPNKYITVPSFNDVTNNTISVFCWVKKNEDGMGNLVVHSDHGTSERSWSLRTGAYPSTFSDDIRVLLSEDGSQWEKQYKTQTAWLADNNWHHVGFTFADNTLKIYVDGIEDTNIIQDSNSPIVSLHQSNAVVRIGAGTYNGYWDQAYEGDISECIIVPVALSAQEVLNLYNYTSVHKLDKPLVTKTDGDGNSITGYESVGVSNQKPGLAWVDFSNTANKFETGDLSFYIETLPVSKNSSEYLICHYNWRFVKYLDKFRYNVGRMNNGSGPFYIIDYPVSNWNKVYKLLGLYHPDPDGGNGYIRFIVADADGTIVKDETKSIGSDIMYVDYGNHNLYIFRSEHGEADGYTGVASKPLIFNRILTESERAALFVGQTIPQILQDTSYSTTVTISKSNSN